MRKSPGHIVCLATSEQTKGGIATVLQTYRSNGLFDRWPIIHLATHRDGHPLRKIGAFSLAYARFLALLATGKIALIHAHTASRASFWRKSTFLAVAYGFKVPAIIHLHGAEFKQFYEIECGPFRKRVVRSILKRAEKIVVLSSQWERWCRGILGDADIQCVFNPAPGSAPFVRTPQTEETPELLFLGRIGVRKGVFDLLKAIPELLKRHPRLRLTCCGDGDLEGALAYAEELGIDGSVEFRRWVAGEEKSRLLNRATVYVLPSYNEGLPMGVLEAMSAGLPVVSTNVGGIPDAIENGVDGCLVEPGDVSALARAIDRLLSDADARERMTEAAREKIERLFSPRKILAQVEQIYGDVLRRGGGELRGGFSGDRS